MFVLRARDLAHAKEIAAADPMHTSGARDYRVRPWLINEEQLPSKVNFASREPASHMVFQHVVDRSGHPVGWPFFVSGEKWD